MGRRSLLLSGTSGVPEGGVSLLDRRGDCKTGPPALELQVDLSEYHLVVALAEFTGVLEGALMGKALNKRLTFSLNSPKAPRTIPRSVGKARSAPLAAVLPGAQ
jgi:hypothetical protein